MKPLLATGHPGDPRGTPAGPRGPTQGACQLHLAPRVHCGGGGHDDLQLLLGRQQCQGADALKLVHTEVLGDLDFFGWIYKWKMDVKNRVSMDAGWIFMDVLEIFLWILMDFLLIFIDVHGFGCIFYGCWLIFQGLLILTDVLWIFYRFWWVCSLIFSMCFSWIVYGCSMDFDGLPVAWKSMNIHENLSRPMSLQQNPSQSMSNPSKSTKITPQIHEKTPINKSKIQQESIKIHPNSWTSIKTHGKSMVIQVTWR